MLRLREEFENRLNLSEQKKQAFEQERQKKYEETKMKQLEHERQIKQVL